MTNKEEKKWEENNKKQGGLWFERNGEKFFVESPFAIALLEYLTGKTLTTN